METVGAVLLAEGELEVLTDPVDPGVKLVAAIGQKEVAVSQCDGSDLGLLSPALAPWRSSGGGEQAQKGPRYSRPSIQVAASGSVPVVGTQVMSPANPVSAWVWVTHPVQVTPVAT